MSLYISILAEVLAESVFVRWKLVELDEERDLREKEACFSSVFLHVYYYFLYIYHLFVIC